MPLLPDSLQGQLRERFEQDLTGSVKVSLFTQHEGLIVIPGRECPTCKETGELLKEVSALSDKLELTVHDVYADPAGASQQGIERIPAIVLEGEARGKVRYFGIPAGSEFPAFVQDLIDVSKGTTSLSEESRQSLGALTKDVHLQVFVTPT
jgi:alkyl hydroperoxide reductase subunit AhpF